MRYRSFLLVVVLMPVALAAKRLCGYKQAVCEKLYWADQFDAQTIQYGWRTYAHFFAPQCARALTKTEFDAQIQSATKLCITSEQFVALGVGNERLERYWGKKTPEEVYPEGDRPRGQQDIDSIIMLMKTTTPVSPVLIGHVRYKDGFEQLVVLDGMHRIIAAYLSGRCLAVYLIDLR